MYRRILVLGLIVARFATAAITVGEWQPLFQGVELAKGEADRAEERMQKVLAVRVDLRAPGIEFFSTPANGAEPGETTSETTVEFVEHYGVQVAINANFFSPCCSPGAKELVGLAISRGEVVSPQEAKDNGAGVLLITRDNRATITVLNHTPIAIRDVWTAISGSGVILHEGKKPANVAREFFSLANPATAVGLSKDRRHLILLTVDGRQWGYSSGASLSDVADWLMRFGAHDGIGLDGGASTTMVRMFEGRAVVMNRPAVAALGAGGVGPAWALRSNGNNFGVYARALEPGSATTEAKR